MLTSMRKKIANMPIQPVHGYIHSNIYLWIHDNQDSLRAIVPSNNVYVLEMTSSHIKQSSKRTGRFSANTAYLPAIHSARRGVSAHRARPRGS